MDKLSKGLTLIEILLVLVVIGLMAATAIPSMSSILNKQALKTKIARLDVYVDKARNLAATTECPVIMRLRPENGDATVEVIVENDPFLKGCSAWHATANNRNNHRFSATLDDVTLDNGVNLQFSAVSGVLDRRRQTRLTLRFRGRTAEISYQGIGKGVVTYD